MHVVGASDNRAVVERYSEEAFNNFNLRAVDEFLAANFIRHDPTLPGRRADREAVKGLISSARSGLPDVHHTFEYVAEDGDIVVVRWAGQGTHHGEFLSVRATGNMVEFSGISIYRVESGRIAEEWTEWDQYGLMQQIGALPRAKRAA